MLVETILLILALAVPVVTGFALAKRKPQMASWKAAGLGSLPLLACFLVFAASIRSQAEVAPFWLGAVAVFGVMSLLIGFGLGMVGHAFGTKGRSV